MSGKFGTAIRRGVFGATLAASAFGFAGAASAQTMGLATMQPGTLAHTAASAIAFAASVHTCLAKGCGLMMMALRVSSAAAAGRIFIISAEMALQADLICSAAAVSPAAAPF